MEIMKKILKKIIIINLLAYCIFFSMQNITYAFKRSIVPSTEIELWWNIKKFPLEFYLSTGGCYDVDDSSDTYAVYRSFNTWEAIECSYVTFNFMGSNSVQKPGFEPSPGSINTNIIYFENEQWPEEYTVHDIAITVLFFNTRSGEIYNADIIFNDIGLEFATDGRSYSHDLQNTLTHELGHVLGLDHEWDTNVTMYFTADLGEVSKRTLHQDDMNGACTIYPINSDPVDNNSNEDKPYIYQVDSDSGLGEDGCSCNLIN